MSQRDLTHCSKAIQLHGNCIMLKLGKWYLPYCGEAMQLRGNCILPKLVKEI